MAKTLKPASDVEKIRVGSRGTGNVNLKQRPVVKNSNGTYSTIDTTSWNVDGKEVLMPTVYKENGEWKHGTPKEALSHYKKTGENLGKFDTVEEATSAAKKYHNQNDFQYGKIADAYMSATAKRERQKNAAKKINKKKTSDKKKK